VFFKVEIEGFKSYREKFATEDFSPKVNCVGNDFIEKLLDSFFLLLIQHAYFFEMHAVGISFMTCHDGSAQ
jgi:hypothetical protein